jgi:hypothetical protein
VKGEGGPPPAQRLRREGSGGSAVPQQAVSDAAVSDAAHQQDSGMDIDAMDTAARAEAAPAGTAGDVFSGATADASAAAPNCEF